jgi:hypothetical protein
MAEPEKIIVFPDEAGDWRWHRVSANGRRTSTSGEDFFDKSGAIRSAEHEAEGTDAIVVVEPEGDVHG